jgi:hypothetical protein
MSPLLVSPPLNPTGCDCRRFCQGDFIIGRSGDPDRHLRKRKPVSVDEIECGVSRLLRLPRNFIDRVIGTVGVPANHFSSPEHPGATGVRHQRG